MMMMMFLDDDDDDDEDDHDHDDHDDDHDDGDDDDDDEDDDVHDVHGVHDDDNGHDHGLYRDICKGHGALLSFDGQIKISNSRWATHHEPISPYLPYTGFFFRSPCFPPFLFLNVLFFLSRLCVFLLIDVFMIYIIAFSLTFSIFFVYSAAYLHHLHKAKEPLASILFTQHNLCFMQVTREVSVVMSEVCIADCLLRTHHVVTMVHNSF